MPGNIQGEIYRRARARAPVREARVREVREVLRAVVLLARDFVRDLAPFASPKRARCLLTTRAATSFSRPRYRPDRSNFLSNCLYSRSRFGLAPLGITLFFLFVVS